MTRAVLFATICLSSLAVSGSAVSARTSLHVRPRVVAAGGSVTVTGNADGCPRGDTVLILSRAFPGHGFAGLGLIRARVRAGGAFTGSGHVRRNASPGKYTVTARCGGGNLGVAASLRVR